MANNDKLKTIVTVLVVYGLGMLTCAFILQAIFWGMAWATPEESAGARQAASQTNWKVFSSEEGNFSVLFPAAPQESLHMPSNSSLEDTIYAFRANVGAVSYEVSYNDQPVTHPADTPEALNTARDRAMAELSGQIAEETPNFINGLHGRHIAFTIPDETSIGGKVGTMQLCLVDNRLYQVAVIGAVNEYSRTDAEQFLTSFTLIDQPNVEARVE